jgi:hypothetical protein
VPHQSLAYSIFFLESQRHTAAGTAITYRVEILPAFNDSVQQTIQVALLKNLPGPFFRYLFTFVMIFSGKDVIAQTE